MIKRLDARDLEMIFEWDEEEESVAFAQAARSAQEREVAYWRLIELHKYLRDVSGVDWVDTELSERHRRLCVGSGMALIWRAEMRTEGGARAVATAVATGLKTSLDEQERRLGE